MAISLAALLGVPSLKLAKAGLAETTWHQDIVWVAVTEQEDPQRFLNGGELVLTTGMRLKSAPEQRRFVRQVQRAGAVGIGFGIGLTHDAVPPALIAQANRWGLPVVEVPYETPFIAIGKLVADAQSADHFTKLERLIAGHQILARALLTGGGLAELLKHLGSMLRTEIVLTQFTAQLYNSATGNPAPSADGWSSFPIPTGRRDACTLWVKQPFEDSGIVGYAQNLISVELNNMVKQRQSQRALAGTGPGGRDPRDPGAQRSHPAARRHRRQQHPQERGPAGRVGRALQAARDVFPASAAGKVGERRRRQGSGGGGPRRRERRQLAGPEPQRPPGGGRDPCHDRHRRSIHKAERPALELLQARDAASHGPPVNEPERLSLTSLPLASEDVPLADMANESLGPSGASTPPMVPN